MRRRSIALTLAGLAFSAFALTACGSSYSASPTSPSAQPAAGGSGGGGSALTVSIANFAFSPTPLEVKVGQQVIWQNSDSVAHTASASAGSFDTGAIAPGASSSPITLSSPGTVQYICRIHSNMVATLNVTQ